MQTEETALTTLVNVLQDVVIEPPPNAYQVDRTVDDLAGLWEVPLGLMDATAGWLLARVADRWQVWWSKNVDPALDTVFSEGMVHRACRVSGAIRAVLPDGPRDHDPEDPKRWLTLAGEMARRHLTAGDCVRGAARLIRSTPAAARDDWQAWLAAQPAAAASGDVAAFDHDHP